MKKKTFGPLNVIVSTVLLLVFCGFLIGVVIWEQNRTDIPSPTVESDAAHNASLSTEQTNTSVTVPPETTLPAYDARKINFLLVGRDWHDEGENGRSDAMILCSVDTGAKSVTMVSFLRDLYLKIPGHGSNRLNASYSWGGAELLKQTLKENFDVDVDVTLEIDFDGFENMIDYLGGVDVTLTEKESAYLNKHYDWTLNDGTVRLNGEQALAYSRIRYLDSDFVRTERQRNILTAMVEKFRTASLEEILLATDTFLDESTSDHSDDELLDLALELYSVISDAKVIPYRIPADGTYTYETVRGMSVIDADLQENREILRNLLGLENRAS